MRFSVRLQLTPREELVAAAVAQAGSDRSWSAKLSGAEEVPARDTPATGKAKAVLSSDGTVLQCKLDVKNISNVVAAHIHLGPRGVNGPVVAFLYGPRPAG